MGLNAGSGGLCLEIPVGIPIHSKCDCVRICDIDPAASAGA